MGAANLFLGVTSLVYHNHMNPLTYWVDQLGIAAVVGSAAPVALALGPVGVCIHSGACLYSGFVYWVGRRTNTMAFHPDPATESIYHASIHLISALGCSALAVL
jgi:hypothetical protein